jgi:Amt family ammonium transporter
VDGYGAILIGLIASGVVWVAWNYLSKLRPFSQVDDAMGVVYTHGIAGFTGGMLIGFFGDPGMIQYIGLGKTPSVVVDGLFYGGGWHQVWEQFLAAVWVICWSGAITALILVIVKFVCRGLREPDENLEVGDIAIHDEEVYPQETFAERVSAMSASAMSADVAARSGGG